MRLRPPRPFGPVLLGQVLLGLLALPATSCRLIGEDASTTVVGTVQTGDFDTGTPGQPCTSPDLAEGAQVTLTEPSTKVIGVGALGAGMPFADKKPDGRTTWWCQFTFSIKDVEIDKGVYGLTVGEQPIQHVSAAELAKPLTITIAS